MDIQAEEKFKDALTCLEQGNPYEAQKIISILFESDLEDQTLVYTNKCCVFWLGLNNRLKAIEDIYERNDRILQEWKNFVSYVFKDNNPYNSVFYAVQKGFFTNALEEFKKLLEDKEPLLRSESYKKVGICYKKLGNFELARTYLLEANKIYPNLSSVLAELADCYSLCGEDKIGKVLFREAFFTDPETIDLDFLDSELIKCLIKKTQSKGFSGKPLLYWIPVFGVLSGVLNIKRELTSQEVARLKKDIYAMENECKDPTCNSEILTPHLLNCYFWLMDHYDLAKENPAKINEVLLKIKILDLSVYEAYIK